MTGAAPSPEPQEEESVRVEPISRDELLATLSCLRTDLQRDLDLAEMLVERLRAGSGDFVRIADLEEEVAPPLSSALRKVCLIEESAFLKGGR